MRKIVIVLLFMGLAAPAALGQSQSFVTTKDNSVLGHSQEVLMNCGASGNNRVAKGDQHIMIMDFDTAAISAWAAANPLVGPWDYYQYELYLHVRSGWDTTPKAVQIQTLNCYDDWAEGDGDWGWWSAGTGASIYRYADARWQWNDNGTPATTGDDFEEINAAASVPWKRQNGAPVSDLPTLPFNFQNEVAFTASIADEGNFVGVVLDNNNDPLDTNLFVEDLLNNPLNRGLRTYKNDGGNEKVDFREQNGNQTNPGPYAPYIQVSITTYVPPVETYTPGPSIRQYDCDKDASLASSSPNGNGGAMDYWRAGKGGRSSGEQVLVEWNARTVSTMTAFIDGQLAANKLTMQEALDLGLLKVEYRFAGHDPDVQKTINIDTVWNPYDWSEGNGSHVDNNFGWTSPTAATWVECQDAWKWNDNGTPATVGDDFPEQDPAATTPWERVIEGYTDQEFKHCEGYYDIYGVVPMVMTGTLQEYVAGNWNSVEMPEYSWKDLLYNVQDEGTIDETHFNCIGLRQWGNGWGDEDNWSMWFREGGHAPNLLITILAVPGDAVVDGKVDVFDLAALANNYESGTGKTWWDADFNGDGEVDVFDLAILANNYGFETIGAGGGEAVPEPASLALLALGGLALIRRRRR